MTGALARKPGDGSQPCQVCGTTHAHEKTPSTNVSSGWSLWLVADPALEIRDKLALAILRDVPLLCPEQKLPLFLPHVTLTSNIDPASIDDPQKWLDSLDLQLAMESAIEVSFSEVAIGDRFFKKLFIRCVKNEGLMKLAKECRRIAVLNGDGQEAERWVREEYDPHCSLMYSDLELREDVVPKMEQKLHHLGVTMGGTMIPDGEEVSSNGWTGGYIVLVATNDTDLTQWDVVAQRPVVRVGYLV